MDPDKKKYLQKTAAVMTLTAMKLVAALKLSYSFGTRRKTEGIKG
jgi:hypothetical protein